MILVEQDVIMPSPGKVIAYDAKGHIQTFADSIPAEKIISGKYRGCYRYLLFSKAKRSVTGVKFNNAALLKLNQMLQERMRANSGDLPVYNSAQAIVDKERILFYIKDVVFDQRGLSVFVYAVPIEGIESDPFRANTSLCIYLPLSRVNGSTSMVKSMHISVKPHNIGNVLGEFCFKQLKVKTK